MNAQLILNWLGENINMNGPATDEEIKECENKIDFKFPDDFKEFYKKVNGFKDSEWDSEMLSLWSSAKIKDEYENSDLIGFCDYCIHLYTIGFLKSKMGIYKAYNVDNTPLISTTFTEFLQQWQNKTMEY